MQTPRAHRFLTRRGPLSRSSRDDPEEESYANIATVGARGDPTNMRALVVTPGTSGSARIADIEEASGEVVVETIAVGVCGTDREIVSGEYGSPPPGRKELVLGHEALGRVVRGGGFEPGELVVPMVRHPDPVPCRNCAIGEWDMCRNGRYTEHGIKERDGFARERFAVAAHRLVRVSRDLGKLGVLLEPASVIAKAWEHVEKIGSRARFEPRRVLITGAGPIGLLAAMMGVQRGLDVHVLDRVRDGLKPRLVEQLGAKYHCGSVAEAAEGADVVIECTGVGQLVIDAMSATGPNGIVCLTGIAGAGRTIALDAATLNRTIVVENDAIFGSVNANRRHYELAAESLARAPRDWLERLITRAVPLADFAEALKPEPDDVKVVIAISG